MLPQFCKGKGEEESLHRPPSQEVGPTALQLAGAGAQKDELPVGMPLHQCMDFVQEFRYPLHLVQDKPPRIPRSDLFHGIEPVLGRMLGIAAILLSVEEVHRPGVIAELKSDEGGFPGLAGTEEKKGAIVRQVCNSCYHGARV